MKPRRFHKKRTAPFVLLAILQFGSFAWLTRADGRFVCRTSGARRQLRTSYSRVREYFQYLEQQRYVTEIKYENGSVSGVVRDPVGMRRVR